MGFLPDDAAGTREEGHGSAYCSASQSVSHLDYCTGIACEAGSAVVGNFKNDMYGGAFGSIGRYGDIGIFAIRSVDDRITVVGAGLVILPPFEIQFIAVGIMSAL